MYKLGIIGFGVVGKSALAFLRNTRAGKVTGRIADIVQQCGSIEVWDNRALNEVELALLQQADATFVSGNTVDLSVFFERHDFVVASPGVDLGAFQQYRQKILCELDFFSTFFYKPVLAVTGSVGKTTITRLLGVLANKLPVSVAPAWPVGANERGHVRAAIGGNVGVGMLDLVKQQQDIDMAIIELSSFQLEYSTNFAPSVALYTNFYPNHLDRHKTFNGYCAAKTTMMHALGPNGVSIFSYDLLAGPAKSFMATELEQVRGQIVITATQKLSRAAISAIPAASFHLLYLDGTRIMLATYENHKNVVSMILVDDVVLSDITFASNWVQVIAGLYLMGLAVDQLPLLLKKMSAEELLPDLSHRVRHIATLRGVDFYDDSKSTIAQATLAAVQRLTEKKRPITLILGGLGKGIDRSWLMPELNKLPLVKRVLCFGPESNQFPGAISYESLEDIVQAIGKTMLAGDIVLFSPSGTSFDFFKNYEHRGQVFEQLVQKLA